jgi:hypothetical protein
VRDSTRWIRDLAKPYLRGLKPVAERGGALDGWWFLRAAPGAPATPAGLPSARRRPAMGIFVGFLNDESGFEYLSPTPPECLAFAFVHPVGGPLHRRMIAGAGAPLRETFTYIRWLTHRPPRFQFFDSELAAMVRHATLREWPEERREHLARNFFIETLAWLVRSGLVRRLAAEPLSKSSSRRPRSAPGR